MAQLISLAAGHLRQGRVIAFPTETVYGLGADATSSVAVRRVFEIKNRPSNHPLIVHVADTAHAFVAGEADDRTRRLAEAFWPGPLTLVLPLLPDSGIAPEVTGGRTTVALRVPRHPIAQALLAEVDRPVAAPSANPHGRVSPTSALHVRADFSDEVELVLDGGPTEVGLESTVLEIGAGPPVLLRAGGIAVEDLEAVTGPIAEPEADAAPRAPGMLSHHYAPRTPLRFGARGADPGEVYLAFGPSSKQTECNLSPSGDLEEAARNLYAMLRELDAAGAAGIAVAPIPEHGIGRAINDRLRRAAFGAAASTGK